MSMQKPAYGKSTIIDDLFHVISVVSEIPAFDHIRLFGTCKKTTSDQMVIAGEWRPETEDGQTLIIPNSPVRFFKYTDEECDWFFDWMNDQLLNPDTNLSVQLLPKCVLVMDPSTDFPFRAEVSLSSFGIDDLANLFDVGSSLLMRGSLGRQFIAYVRPTFLPEKRHPSFNAHPLKPSFGGGMPSDRGQMPSIPPDYIDFANTPSPDANSLFGDILSQVDSHVNQPTLLTGLTPPSAGSILTGDAQQIVDDASMADMIASRANMDRNGAELQRQITKLANEFLPSPDAMSEEEGQSVAPSDVSTETSATAVSESETVPPTNAQTVEDMAAVDSMFPQGMPPETVKE